MAPANDWRQLRPDSDAFEADGHEDFMALALEVFFGDGSGRSKLVEVVEPGNVDFVDRFGTLLVSGLLASFALGRLAVVALSGDAPLFALSLPRLISTPRSCPAWELRTASPFRPPSRLPDIEVSPECPTRAGAGSLDLSVTLLYFPPIRRGGSARNPLLAVGGLADSA